MTAWHLLTEHWGAWALWSLIGSAVMATLLEGAQLLGISRLSLPFLMGTMATEDRRWAMILGYTAYLIGGFLFGLLYALVMGAFPAASVWAYILAGVLTGLVHGLFLVTVALPLWPNIHPRLTSDYDGPEALIRMEPPGPFGTNYGFATPGVAVGAQTLFGLLMGIGYGAALAHGG